MLKLLPVNQTESSPTNYLKSSIHSSPMRMWQFYLAHVIKNLIPLEIFFNTIFHLLTAVLAVLGGPCSHTTTG